MCGKSPLYRGYFYVIIVCAFILLIGGTVVVAEMYGLNQVDSQALISIFKDEISPLLLLICGALLIAAGILLLLHSLIPWWILFDTGCMPGTRERANKEM